MVSDLSGQEVEVQALQFRKCSYVVMNIDYRQLKMLKI